MTPRLEAISLVARDLPATLAFCRSLGLEIPANRSLVFACADPAEVDRVDAELVAGGHPSHLEPFDAPWGQRYATVLDPDGDSMDLFTPLC